MPHLEQVSRFFVSGIAWSIGPGHSPLGKQGREKQAASQTFTRTFFGWSPLVKTILADGWEKR
jgi:hypothetical protein